MKLNPPAEAQNAEELFEVVDADDKVIGVAKRRECHGNPKLVHRTAHVVVRRSDGALLLQRRSMAKDIQPGKWDTAVGGHLEPGEDYEAGARREMSEELGIPSSAPLEFLFKSQIRNSVESENVGVYATVNEGPFAFNPAEIDQVRFWTKAELLAELEAGAPSFTPNLVKELGKLLKADEA
jgi:isopentenyldiphosphate isomerase